jgi:hypothetical protein
MSEQASFDANSRASASPFLVFRISWVAYLREVWAVVIRLLIFGFITLALMNIITYIFKLPERNG